MFLPEDNANFVSFIVSIRTANFSLQKSVAECHCLSIQLFCASHVQQHWETSVCESHVQHGGADGARERASSERVEVQRLGHGVRDLGRRDDGGQREPVTDPLRHCDCAVVHQTFCFCLKF